MNRYLDVAPEVQQAVAEGRPVVALESTIISHGMPYPQNVETALNVEKIIRENGAVPATIAIIGGRLKAGLTPQEIDYLGKSGHAVTKAILDLGLTLEYLETKGVPVIGYGTKELPAFYTRKSGFAVDYEIDTPEDLAKAFHVARQLDMKGGMLVTNPIPEEYSMDHKVIDAAIEQALADAKAQGIHGKETTPFLLARVKDLTGGNSLESNIQLVYNNARLAAKTACALQTLEQA